MLLCVVADWSGGARVHCADGRNLQWHKHCCKFAAWVPDGAPLLRGRRQLHIMDAAMNSGRLNAQIELQGTELRF